MNSKLLQTFTRNTKSIVFMSTQSTVESVSSRKFEYYKKLNEIQNIKNKPEDWDDAKPFESLPGPKPLPIIGNSWRFFIPKIGDYYGLNFLEINKKIHEEYGDIAIFKGIAGQKPIVLLYNPDDFEKLHRNEGVWPIRKGLDSFEYYREFKKDKIKIGLVTLQGEEWYKFRSIVNPILMHPRNIAQYTDKMNSVADDLLDNMRYFSQKSEQNQMPDDFQRELYKWSLESVGLVTMDTHLNCLKRNNDNTDNKKLIQSVMRMFDLMYVLDVLPSLWKYLSTPAWREYVKTLDTIIEINLKYVNERLDKMSKGEVTDDSHGTESVLAQLLKIDRDTALAMSVDMLTAGIDTTGRILAAALYYLAKNPEKQEELRKEAFKLLKNKNSPVTKETLNQNLYTKAVIKETTRLAPIAIGNFRNTTKDLVLAGYQIPTGTAVSTNTLLLCRNEKYFKRASEFLPERWQATKNEELSRAKTNPFVFAPFGTGPRSCIGKRLANLELEVALLKIVRNFDLKWPHDDMEFKLTVLYGIAKPLNLEVKELEN